MAEIDPQELADELYKLSYTYYDDIPEKTKMDMAYKNVVARKAEQEQQNQMGSLSAILKNTQPLPAQFAGMERPVEPDPIKRQQILDTQEQAMIAKQDAGGTFTNADMEPYMRAGIQSQYQQSASQPADQFIQSVGAGVDPNVAKMAIALNQPEKPPKGELEYRLAIEDPNTPPELKEQYKKAVEGLQQGKIQITQERGKSFADNRIVSVYDNEKDRVIKTRGKIANDNPDRYLDPADPDVRTLVDVTKRSGLIETFTNRIEATTKVVQDTYSKINNRDSRLLNVPINKLSSVLGSGELASVKLALKSLSNEIAKVESGSLGIAEVSVGQAEFMKKIHDENLSLKDMQMVMDTGLQLGRTNMQSINKVKQNIKARLRGEDVPEESLPPIQNNTSGMSREEMIAELKRRGKL